jgi:C4-type Zn-finger protein
MVPRKSYSGPESCLCPMCKEVMRLYSVPALKSLDITQFYFRCDACEYASVEVTEMSPDSICDIRREGESRTLELVARCESEIAKLLGQGIGT